MGADMKQSQRGQNPTQNEHLYPLAFFLLVMLFSWPPSLAAEGESSSPWNFRLKAEAGVRYDDNILSLSEEEKALLDDPTQGGSERFGINNADDFIVAPEVIASFDRKPRRGRGTKLSLNLHAFKYTNNSIKDYQQFGLSLSQELTRRSQHYTTLTIKASRIPEYFLRKLKDEDESALAGMTIRNDLDYALNRGYIELSHELVNRLMTIEGGFAVERRNYNLHFNERDSSSTVSSLGVKIYPLRRIIFRLHPSFERESRRARGDLPTSTVLDDDVGFDGYLFGLDLRWLWGQDEHHRNTIEVWGKREKRDFITSLATDLGHFDRQDEITQFGMSYERELGLKWELRFAYRHRVNDISTLSPTGGKSSSSFKKNVYYATVVYRFDSPSRRSR